jgi:DNA-directed RNA polymerase specialized sigma24 family protein
MPDNVERMVREVFHSVEAYGPDAETRIREVGKAIRKGRVEDPEGYAYVSARNFLTDKYRRAESRRRAREQEEKERAKAAYVHSMCTEFWALVQTAPVGDRVRAQEMRQSLALYLEGYDTPELTDMFGVTRDVIYQWRKRALDQLEPYMSAQLKKFVGRKKVRKIALCRRAD